MSWVRLYVSTPHAGYDGTTHARVLDAFRQRGAEIIDSRQLFASPDAWQRGWREALRQADALLVLLGPGRLLGCGAVQEIAEARALGKVVFFAQPNGAVRPAERTWWEVLPGRNRARFVRVNFEPRRSGKKQESSGSPGA
ncbi:MAG: hypothetical protein QN144_13690 [Armatimonadota bacterium]|nr:hypothetical protein [Armatimonadota bacterium]